MSNKNYDYIFKILILGIGTVGKACVLLKFIDDSFCCNKLNYKFGCMW